MDLRRLLMVGSMWLHLLLFLHEHSLWGNCVELQVSNNLADCLFEDMDACNQAEGNLCKWSESSQKCYPKANKQSFLRRQLKAVQDCSDVIYKDQCKSLEHCRWCRSEVLDDGCFKALEARRLPLQVFDCSSTL
ncbi:hypothetical protein GOP47_0017257 [Adiantum capillus-veneris]|uniref:Uncharacterized protein n=1 Tax=Adiantum capillus-veneris TaxID=13818 RepID=A0A9D4UJK5_ADICA|nr:hypothetical protein GOP47_0017257 [Adiantum capillus-veneris]